MELEFDEAQAKRAFESLEPEARALEDALVAPVRVDLRRAARQGLTLAQLVAQPEQQARFAKLPSDLFDPSHLERLVLASWALWYTTQARASSEQAERGIRMPEALLAESRELKEAMWKTLEFYVGDAPEVARDLSRLATLYETHSAPLSSDTKRYKPTDHERARSLAGQLLRELSAPEGETWTQLQARIWTLFLRSYQEIRATGAYLWRAEPAKAEQFTSPFV
jgi:hypothetical protein